MQVVGNARIEAAVHAVAARAADSWPIRDWVLRVLPRHVRRTRGLLERVPDHGTLTKLMRADGIPAEAAQRIMVGFRAGEDVLMPSGSLETEFLRRAADVIDWVRSLPAEDRRIRRIERMSWLDAVEHSAAWHAALAKPRSVSADLMEGTRKIADLDAGVFMVELESRKALAAEGSAMGHCVGGYWQRVASGQSRIVSLRDEAGQPHVTIELARPHRIEVVGLGQVSVAKAPPNGISRLIETNGDWRAVQIRGKGNKVPVERWLRPVMDWLGSTGIAWGENIRDDVVDREGPIVYTVAGVPYADPLAAMNAGGRAVLADIAQRKSFFAYERSGLRAVHEHSLRECAGSELASVDGFLASALPLCMDILTSRMRSDGSMSQVLREIGLRSLLDIASSSPNGNERRKELLGALLGHGSGVGRRSTLPIVEGPYGHRLEVVVHEVPLIAVALLSSGLASGAEDIALDGLRPHLAEVLEEVVARPEAIHAVVSIEGLSIPEDDVLRGFLATGLAREYSLATATVDEGVKSRRREMIRSLKRARSEGSRDDERLNHAMNVLSDGFETRLVGLVQNLVRGRPLLIRPTLAPQPEAKPSASRAASLVGRGNSAAGGPTFRGAR